MDDELKRILNLAGLDESAVNMSRVKQAVAVILPAAAPLLNKFTQVVGRVPIEKSGAINDMPDVNVSKRFLPNYDFTFREACIDALIDGIEQRLRELSGT